MNPLAIRIAADLKAFQANMAEMRVQLETNASAMKRMSSSFDGSKVIGDANAMVKAIHDIGGAAKLTEAEQRRVNATVTEALAKYQALGREAPPELLKLRDATSKVEPELKKMVTGLEKVPEPVGNISAKMMALGAAAGTFLGQMAFQAVNKLGAEIGEFAKRGMQLAPLQASFLKLSSGVKQSADEMLSGMQRASRGMVSDFDLMKSANKAMLLGLPVTSKEMGTLTAAATTLGRAMGMDATKSVDDLITALGRSSPMILDNLGLTVKVGEANEIYAKKLGKTVEKLTDAEKKTAFYNEAMRKAIEKTEELGVQTLTLGDYLGILWTSVGNKVSSGVNTANVAAGSLISGMGEAKRVSTSFWDSLSMGSIGAAFNLGGFGRTTSQVAAIMTNSIPPIKERIRVTRELTAEEKAAAKAFQEQVDQWTGAAATQGLAAIRKHIDAAGGVAKLTSERYGVLEKALSDLVSQGGKTDAEFMAIVRTHDLLNTKIPITANAYSFLFSILRDMPSAKLTLPLPKFDIPVGNDPFEIIKHVERAMVLAGKDTRIKLAPAPVAESLGKALLSAFGKSLSNIGNVIVGAIQGGGNVLKSVFASIGNDLASAFSASYINGLKSSGMSTAMQAISGAAMTAGWGIVIAMIPQIVEGFKAVNRELTSTELLLRSLETRLKAIGQLGKELGAVFKEAMSNAFSGGGAVRRGDAESFINQFEQYKTKGELEKIAVQWKAMYDSMLKSGLYTAATLADAWKKYQDALKEASGIVDPIDTRPVGARGFPTRAELMAAANAAKEAYDYMLASGLYTTDVLEQAWEQWQDSLIASGDKVAKRMKELNAEILSLQEAIALELPEYDANGVRMYGVVELQNIERLAALEAEKAALTLAQIAEQEQATVEAAAAADLQAKKEFEVAKQRAITLDGEMRRIFSVGYDIPIRFLLPGMPPVGAVPNNGGAMAAGGSGIVTRPTLFMAGEAGPEHYSFTPLRGRTGGGVTINVNNPQVRSDRDIHEITRQIVRLIPAELDFIGARR